MHRLIAARVVLIIAMAFSTASLATPHTGLAGTNWIDMNGTSAARLFVAESDALPKQEFSAADGRFKGTALSISPPRFEPPEESADPTVQGFLAKDEPYECSFYSGMRLSPAENMTKRLERMGKRLTIRAAVVADVQAIQEAPMITFEILYTTDSGQIGDYQVSYALWREFTVMCTHDGTGYRESFLRAARSVSESTLDTKAGALLEPTYASLYIARIQGHAVGFDQVFQLSDRRSGVGFSNRSFTDLAFPSAGGPSKPVFEEEQRTDWVDATGGLDQTHAVLLHKGVWSTADLLSAEGTDYEVKGDVDEKPMGGHIHTGRGFRSPLTSEMLKLVQGGEDLKFESYSPQRPLEAHAVTMHWDRKKPGLVEVHTPGVEVEETLQLDATGDMTEMNISLGANTLTFARIATRGTPH